MTLSLREERMGPHMLKVHLEGTGGTLHHFTAPDFGAPHDHPFRFRSTILTGGYVEEVFTLDGGVARVVHRPGDSFVVEAEHIHRLVELPAGEAWTLMLPLGPKVREPGFYEWREGRAWHRPWWRPEFEPVGMGG